MHDRRAGKRQYHWRGKKEGAVPILSFQKLQNAERLARIIPRLEENELTTFLALVYVYWINMSVSLSDAASTHDRRYLSSRLGTLLGFYA